MSLRPPIYEMNRSLNHNLGRRLSRCATAMLDGVRRPREPDYLALACRLYNQALRISKRMAKADPHLFGPRARDYYLDTLRMEREQREIETVLRKVYGPPAADQPQPVSTLWTDRYYPRPGQRRLFLKWFHEQYPSR